MKKLLIVTILILFLLGGCIEQNKINNFNEWDKNNIESIKDKQNDSLINDSGNKIIEKIEDNLEIINVSCSKS